MSRIQGGTSAPRGGTRANARDLRVTRSEEFFRGLVSEMRRVTWPTRDEWIAATLMTIGLVIVISAYTYVLDEGFGAFFGFIHK
ncbi:MAG TPA: preprotein translocase subunit SecE [Candidatus Baltobacteraceae bacterium]|jgi:preprotein translocase SecE subunit|nr:preprotein translocase subunit SecE [Candidatus Baltobacteraceae bacterium]